MINILKEYGLGGCHRSLLACKVDKIIKEVDLLYPRIQINIKYKKKYCKTNKEYFNFINKKKDKINVISVTYTKAKVIKIVYNTLKEV